MTDRYPHPGGYGYVNRMWRKGVTEAVDDVRRAARERGPAHRLGYRPGTWPELDAEVADLRETARRWVVSVDPAIALPVWDLDYRTYTEPVPALRLFVGPLPDRPTTEENTTVTTATATETPTTTTTTTTDAVPTTSDEPPTLAMYLTLDMLRELGSCGDYLRRFGNEFPRSRHPRGVLLDEANCHRHYRIFDWSWARDVMLNTEGVREYHRLVEDGSRATRDRFGTGDARRARVLGHLLETRPEYRSDRLVSSARSAAERADDRFVRDVEAARLNVTEARNQVEYWARLLAEREAALPALEAKIAPVLARRAQRQADAAAAQVRDLEARLVAQQTALEAARAEAARLAELVPPADEPTPMPAADTPDATGTVTSDPQVVT